MALLLKQIPSLPEASSYLSSDLIHIRNGSIDKKITVANLFGNHVNNQSNPHNVTKAQLGLSNLTGNLVLEQANNLSDVPDKAAARSTLSVPTIAQLTSHTGNQSNPHNVTKAQLGLGSLSGNLVLEQANNLSDVPNKAAARANLGVPSLTDLAGSTPSGVITMWYGTIATIPTGWVLCNGSNGTPDMRNRFPIGSSGDGSGSYPKGATGGATSVTHNHSVSVLNHTLTVSEIPKHSHGSGHNAEGGSPQYGRNNNALNKNRYQIRGEVAKEWLTSPALFTEAGVEVTGTTSPHTHGANISSASTSILPPYRAIHFIMKV